MATVELDRLLQDLRSRDDNVRARASKQFQEQLYANSRTQAVPGFPSALFGRIDGKILNKCITLCSSVDINDKLAGVSAIDSMLGILPPEELSTAVKLAANVLKALPCPDPFVMALAARVYARLAQAGGLLMQAPVNIQLKQIIEWLQGERIEFRRWGAVLLLRELSRTVPALVFEHIPELLDNVWTALRDTRVAIREVAAGALSGCLKIANDKDGMIRQDWYLMVYDQAAKGLKISASPDTIHGSLLGFQELFTNTGMFMSSRYREVCDQILHFKDHREALVRQAVVLLLPSMAKYSPTEFTQFYLHRCMMYLLVQLKKERERAIAFDAIGRIATHINGGMAPYLDAILGGIKEGLQARGRRGAPLEGPIFECIALLAKSVGSVLTKYMHDLLDLMLAYGLSENLVVALKALADNIAPLLSDIQFRLLNLISILLSGEPYRHPGQPAQPAVSNFNKALNGSVSSAMVVPLTGIATDAPTITLALRTLGSFDFTGHILSDFVSSCVVGYLEDENPQIRLAAAQTTSKLFKDDPIVRQTSHHAVKLVGEVLEKLLTVAVTDSDPVLRAETLQSLDESFDRHLAQAENIRSLFIALNDEDFDVRQLAIGLIGRLSLHNPAYVMPSLRKTLIQLLTELEYSTKDREKEQAAILLSQLVGTSHRITKPYIMPMLKVLMPKARDRNPDVAAAIATALGDLAQVGAEDVTPKISNYMELILENIHDQSSLAKREAALRTLSQLSSNSGYVIEPYIQYPTLLNTLIALLQTETAPLTRREIVRAMGNIGALDPYRYTAIERSSAVQGDDFAADPSNLAILDTVPSSDDSYYPATAFKALLSILKDSSLSSHHTAVVEAIMYIFRSLRLKCVQFLPQIIPAFVGVMRSCPPKLEEYYIQNLGHLISSVKQHIRGHLDPILSLVTDFWNSGTTLQVIIVDLIESIGIAMEGEFKMYLPRLLPLMLQAFEDPTTAAGASSSGAPMAASGIDPIQSRKSSTQLRVLRAFGAFGNNLEEYLHLVLPAVVRSFERTDGHHPLSVRKAAVACVNALCRKINFSEHASRVVQPLTRALGSAPHDLRTMIMDTLCALMTHIGPDFAIFVPLISRTLSRYRIQHAQYDHLVEGMLRGEALPHEFGVAPYSYEEEADPAADAGVGKLPVNQQNLKSAWEISTERAKAEDWREWLRRLSVQMLKSSPSHSLRACANLAEVYHPLARDLFNAAFVSCWSELFDNYQDELVRSIETALASPTVPAEVMQTLLNLAEFMEHDEKLLPIPVHQLGEYAKRCHAYAKALHYKETEFFSTSSYEVVEDLIRINNHLQQPDVAMGILKFAQQHFEMQRISEDWYERLERWDDALAAYERRQEEEPDNFEFTHGRMRCLHALGEWDSLSSLAQEHWQYASLETKRKIASLAAASAWGQQDFDAMEDFVSVLKHDSADRAWFKSILNIQRGQFGKAQSHINRARDLLVGELTTLVGESYTRAYSQVVRIQMLSELEEIIQYKQAGVYIQQDGSRERRAMIQKTWMRRLKGCQRDVEVWQRVLKVRALVVNPRDSMDMWIRFANLCRKSGRMGLAEKTLNSLFGLSEAAAANAYGRDYLQQGSPSPHVIYAHIKFLWAKGDRAETLAYLHKFTQKLSDDLGLGTDGTSRPRELQQGGESQMKVYTRLLARCYYKQAEWAMALSEDEVDLSDDRIVAAVLGSYRQATVLDKHWHKAWHSFALANSQVMSHYMKTRDLGEHDPIPHAYFSGYLVPAVNAFFHSIALSPSNALQDTLRLLTLWFNHGGNQEVYAAISEGFTTVSVDVWLEVIPQLIARIHAPQANIRRLVQQILADVGRQHPQALVYALTVASKYPSAPRRRAAVAILDKMREHSPRLVDQAQLVSAELMRVAVLWHEQWHECLEEASRLYYGQNDVDGMFGKLEPMHNLMEQGAETLKEVAFESAYGHDLAEAREAGRRFRAFGEATDLNAAWELYYSVFRKTDRVLTNNKPDPGEQIIELEYCSPKLLGARDLELAVPGTYQSGKPIIRIVQFSPVFDILTSKQRPRKLKISGSDGNDYPFLLKGHEDLRQDERVMQLFGLVNTLMNKDPETFKRHLMVQKYPAIPLSPQSGMLGWLSGTDTMHLLIRAYREARKILVNIEQRLMIQMAPNYENLCLMQKIEVFQYALDNTTGQDLYRILWLKSKSSEAWLDRRANYSRSLAVMSMVGYCLGLGDRHPSNLLLSRENGTVIHVDYGDCFEVAMIRDKYPEKVPFRLTRMLQNAMDVSRIEGTFRVTCEHTMRVLRENRESIIAVLEAFSRDPLVNWRLVIGGRQVEDTQPVHGQERSRRPRADETNQMDDETNEAINLRALQVVDRVTAKLQGKDYGPVTLTVEQQVQELIKQATALENLATAFVGWCAFW